MSKTSLRFVFIRRAIVAYFLFQANIHQIVANGLNLCL